MSYTGRVPTGYYLATKNYVDESPQLGQGKPEYIELQPGETPAEGFVAVIPHGRVWGSSGCVITPNQKILWDVSREWDNSPRNHTIFQQPSLPPSQRTDETVAVLSKIGSHNYYHWMFDVLPRIHLLRLSGIGVNKYIVPQPLAPFQSETLATLGISEQARIGAGPGFHLESARLVVPALPSEAKWAVDFVRSELLQHRHFEGHPGFERIYVSRQNAIGRTVVNEQELMAALEPLGFTKIMPEGLSVAEQVQLFSQAKVIVGPQGAGFANAFFCSPKVHIIELMSPSFFITSTEKICSYVNVHYHRIMGTSQRHPKYLNSDWYWNGLDNILVDVGKVRQVVHSVLSNPQA